MEGTDDRFDVWAIGWVESPIKDPALAPRQGDESAPPAVIRLRPEFLEGARDIRPGDELFILTWLHLSGRDVLSVHPRGDRSRPLTGVFSTRSPERPNPIGLHRVTVRAVVEDRIEVDGLEAVDGTPVLDLKPVLRDFGER